MDEETIIYGLETQTRALSAQIAETEQVNFFVGTQTLRFVNQVHLINYDDDNNTLSKAIFLHDVGEIWDIAASLNDKTLLSTCYNKLTDDSRCSMKCSLWRIPEEVELTAGGNEDASGGIPLQLLCNVEEQQQLDNASSDDARSTSVKCLRWQPGDDSKCATITDSQILVWDLKESSTRSKLVRKIAVEGRNQPHCITGQWNPHHGSNQICAAVEGTVKAWDVRQPSAKPAWSIESAHNPVTRDLDFNPNKQYYLASCGDDFSNKFWDIRNTATPLLTYTNHSHWVWSVKYNHFHDQLILTSSSDSKVILSKVASLSSEPGGKLFDENDNSGGDNIGEDNSGSENDVDGSNRRGKKPLSDGIISVYGEHEESVYSVAWSNTDTWIFASLSYDGCLIINKVPRSVKYEILL